MICFASAYHFFISDDLVINYSGRINAAGVAIGIFEGQYPGRVAQHIGPFCAKGLGVAGQI